MTVIFKIYDIKNDDVIDADELYQVLKTMVQDSIDNEELVRIVDQTMREADGDKDGFINFEEFSKVCMCLLSSFLIRI